MLRVAARLSGSPRPAPPRWRPRPDPAARRFPRGPWLPPPGCAPRLAPRPRPRPVGVAGCRVREHCLERPGSWLASGLHLCGREWRTAPGALSRKAKARLCGCIPRAEGGEEDVLTAFCF